MLALEPSKLPDKFFWLISHLRLDQMNDDQDEGWLNHNFVNESYLFTQISTIV